MAASYRDVALVHATPLDVELIAYRREQVANVHGRVREVVTGILVGLAADAHAARAGYLAVIQPPAGQSDHVGILCVRSHVLSAAGGIRTHTPLRTMPFESIASAVPPPPQVGHQIYRRLRPGAAAARRDRRARRTAARDAPARRSSPVRSRASRRRSGASVRARSAA